METAAAATIASASQMGRGRGNVGSWNKWRWSRVSLSPTLGGQERMLTTHCPLLAACAGPSSRRWLQAGLWSQVPCVQVQVLPFTTLCDCKQRANLFTPVSLCVKYGLIMVSHSKGCWENYMTE